MGKLVQWSRIEDDELTDWSYGWGKYYGSFWARMIASDAELFEWGNSECLGGIMPLPDSAETIICRAMGLAEVDGEDFDLTCFARGFIQAVREHLFFLRFLPGAYHIAVIQDRLKNSVLMGRE